MIPLTLPICKHEFLLPRKDRSPPIVLDNRQVKDFDLQDFFFGSNPAGTRLSPKAGQLLGVV